MSRTFGCVRVVWNRTLAARHARWHAGRKGTSYAETDRALTLMKREPEMEFLNEVSAVPLQQALRHQQAAFSAFFEKRARYPRFKSRRGRQAATYTRVAFHMKDGALRLAKTDAPLRFVWTYADLASLDPTSVTVTRDPAGPLVRNLPRGQARSRAAARGGPEHRRGHGAEGLRRPVYGREGAAPEGLGAS